MKLKNSYILLIIMSLFLLVSIGSVCAQDNSTSDAGILASESNDITLSEDAGEKINTTVESENVKVNEKDPVEIPVTVKDNNNSIIDIAKGNLTVTEGNKTINFNYNNSKINIIDKLALGNHSLNINYLGNDIYKNSTKKIILSIFGNYTMITPTAVNVNSTKIGELPVNITNKVDVAAVSASDFNITITYKEGNDTKIINVNNIEYADNKLKFSYSLANTISASTMTVIYNGTFGNFKNNVTLNRIYNIKLESIVNTNQYKNGAYKFKVTDIDDSTTSLKGKSVSLTTIGNIRAGFSATIDENNTVSYLTRNLYEFDNTNNTFDMKEFAVGKHAVEISTSGDLKSTSLKLNLTVTKAEINIKIANFKEEYGTNKNVTITVTSKVDGTPVPGIILHLNMPQTSGKNYYFITDTDGQSKISVKSLVGGDYDVTVTNNDTKNIKNTKATGKITIVPKPVVITTKSVTITYNSGNTATIKITDKKTGKVVPNAIVLVKLYTGSKYKAYLFQATDKGIVKFAASLSVGKHKMVVETADTRYKASSVTKYITVKKASAKFKAPKVSTYYKSGKYFTVTLVNSKNKPVYDAKVNIKVFVSKNRYYNYNGNTGSNGQIRLSLSTLKPGSYNVVIAKGESKNYTAKQATSKIVIKKSPTKLIPAKKTAKKGKNAYFNVTVKNTKTKKIIAGVKVNVKVYTDKTYKTYTIKTNSKGVAKLNTKSLSVGTHKVVVSSANKYCVAKAVTSTIKITK